MGGYKMEQGKFIVLDGIDGSGTSTHSALLVKYLFEKDKKNVVLLTREPTKLSPYGLELRRRLTGNLLPEETVINDADYWANLFINDRQWHINKVVMPSLQLGLQVVSDRYDLSTIAYQSAQGRDMDELIRKHEGLQVPDLTILLDIPVETTIQRITKDAQRTQEYFDDCAFQQKVRLNYLAAVQKLSNTRNIAVIDSSHPIDQVAKEIQQEVNKLYGYR